MDPTYTVYESSSTVDEGTLGIVSILFLFVYIAAIILIIASVWKLFKKAGKPGWAAIVPIYNTVVMLEIAGRPIWWLLFMMLVPFFGWWLAIVAMIDFAKSYGKSTGFGVFLAIFPYIGFPVLAFGKNQYVGPIAEGLSTFAPAPSRAPSVTAVPVAAPVAEAPVDTVAPVAPVAEAPVAPETSAPTPTQPDVPQYQDPADRVQ